MVLSFWFIGYILKYPGYILGFSSIVWFYLDLNSNPTSSSFLKSLTYFRNSFGTSLSRSSLMSRGSIPIPSLGAAYKCVGAGMKRVAWACGASQKIPRKILDYCDSNTRLSVWRYGHTHTHYATCQALPSLHINLTYIP